MKGIEGALTLYMKGIEGVTPDSTYSMKGIEGALTLHTV